jgi:hypothetical protein
MIDQTAIRHRIATLLDVEPLVLEAAENHGMIWELCIAELVAELRAHRLDRDDQAQRCSGGDDPDDPAAEAVDALGRTFGANVFLAAEAIDAADHHAAAALDDALVRWCGGPATRTTLGRRLRSAVGRSGWAVFVHEGRRWRLQAEPKIANTGRWRVTSED